MLADTRKRHTKEEIAAEVEKKKVDEETTKLALHRVHQFIADEEDKIVVEEGETNAKIVAPSRRPVPLVRQNAVILGYKRQQYADEIQNTPGKMTRNIAGWSTLTLPQLRGHAMKERPESKHVRTAVVHLMRTSSQVRGKSDRGLAYAMQSKNCDSNVLVLKTIGPTRV